MRRLFVVWATCLGASCALAGCASTGVSVTEHRPIGSCCAEVVESWYLEPATNETDEALRHALQTRLTSVCALPFLSAPDSAEGTVQLSTKRDSTGALLSASFALTRRGTRQTRAIGGVTIAPGVYASEPLQTARLANQLVQRIWKGERTCPQHL